MSYLIWDRTWCPLPQWQKQRGRWWKGDRQARRAGEGYRGWWRKRLNLRGNPNNKAWSVWQWSETRTKELGPRSDILPPPLSFFFRSRSSCFRLRRLRSPIDCSDRWNSVCCKPRTRRPGWCRGLTWRFRYRHAIVRTSRSSELTCETLTVVTLHFHLYFHFRFHSHSHFH